VSKAPGVEVTWLSTMFPTSGEDSAALVICAVRSMLSS
jgi:hypothetical protein